MSSLVCRSPVSVLILGAAGMLGQRLVRAILRSGKLGERPISQLLLADAVATTVPAHSPDSTRAVVADISRFQSAADLVAERPDVIFHLAAVVSGEAEADFDKGYSVNFDGTRNLFEAIRQLSASDGYNPRLVFTSSLAVFGAPFPDFIPDTFFTTPSSSYGTQKAMAELLLADYTRRGFLDGIGIRLPTISIRPGKPNKAASSFYSSILREPLNGENASLPVEEDTRHWFASPRAAIGFLLHAATLDSARLGSRRTLTMPGLSATVKDQLDALRRSAGDRAAALVKKEPNSDIARIVKSWPERFDAERAINLGFTADKSFDEIIAVYREDEMQAN